MSRSVSAPSSVTNTSPCWNGDIVPGSTLMYGSNFMIVTRRPRSTSSRPSDAAAMPFPREDTTPPVTNTNFVECCIVTPASAAEGLSPRGQVRLRAPQVVFRIDAGQRRLGEARHPDRHPVTQRPQLLELLGLLGRRRLEHHPARQRRRRE